MKYAELLEIYNNFVQKIVYMNTKRYIQKKEQLNVNIAEKYLKHDIQIRNIVVMTVLGKHKEIEVFVYVIIVENNLKE